MAYSYVWYQTQTPQEITDIICNDIIKFDDQLKSSKVIDYDINTIEDKKIRNSRNAWIPSSHWIPGFVWHYIALANRMNFLYDIECIDGETLQYTEYREGCFYDWHADSSIKDSYMPKQIRGMDRNIHEDMQIIKGESIRKLSFTMQLSDPEEYDGGEFQLMDQGRNMFYGPKEKGSIIIFDSRLSHRIRKVKSGVRKSLVGWVVGPRWK